MLIHVHWKTVFILKRITEYQIKNYKAIPGTYAWDAT